MVRCGKLQSVVRFRWALWSYGVHKSLIGEDTSMKAGVAILATALRYRPRFMGGIGVCRLRVE